MEKFKIHLLTSVSLIITLLIVVSIIWCNSNSNKIKTICKNLKIIDANIDHNQALDVIDYAKENGVKIPKTIVNFDTHSDMYVYKTINPKYGAHVYDWLNEYFAQNPNAEELYWVMPKEEATDKDMQIEFAAGFDDELFDVVQGNIIKDEKLVNPNVHQIPYIQYFVLDKKTAYMKEVENQKEASKFVTKNPQYKTIKIITCTEKTLPDFKNRNIILSIDSDYISNSGYDTTIGFSNNKNEQEIKIAISKLLSTIKNKNIRPEIISLTLSPKYVPAEDEEQMYKFMQKFIKHSGKKDKITEYTRQVDSPRITDSKPKYKGF